MKIEIKLINNSSGVYAQKEIRKGEIVFKISTNQFLSLPTKYSVQIAPFKHVESHPSSANNNHDSFFWRYMNHSCDANCFFNTTDLSFRAIRKIATGEHLTFNYLTNEYDMAEPFKCECKSPLCFKTIQGFRHLNDLQKEKLLPLTSEHVRLLYMREEVIG